MSPLEMRPPEDAPSWRCLCTLREWYCTILERWSQDNVCCITAGWQRSSGEWDWVEAVLGKCFGLRARFVIVLVWLMNYKVMHTLWGAGVREVSECPYTAWSYCNMICTFALLAVTLDGLASDSLSEWELQELCLGCVGQFMSIIAVQNRYGFVICVFRH